jgi:hypothetical protein
LSEGTFTPPETPQTPEPSRSFRVPAEYYSTPVTARPLFPRWVPIGCGIAAALIIAILFLGGVIASRGGVGRVMDFLLARMETEMTGMYAADVPPESRKALESELDSLRQNIRTDRVSVAKLDPVMAAVREAIADQKLTNAEVEQVRKKIREANAPAPAKR